MWPAPTTSIGIPEGWTFTATGSHLPTTALLAYRGQVPGSTGNLHKLNQF